MCQLLVQIYSCGHVRKQHKLCPLITAEEIQWAEETRDVMTIMNNCQEFLPKKRNVDSPCGKSCVKAHDHGWRCCDCLVRHHAGEKRCTSCGHMFCAVDCYALGPDDEARMTSPFEGGVTMPMDIAPVKRWGSGSHGRNPMCPTGFRWGLNYSSDRSS